MKIKKVIQFVSIRLQICAFFLDIHFYRCKIGLCYFWEKSWKKKKCSTWRRETWIADIISCDCRRLWVDCPREGETFFIPIQRRMLESTQPIQLAFEVADSQPEGAAAWIRPVRQVSSRRKALFRYGSLSSLLSHLRHSAPIVTQDVSSSSNSFFHPFFFFLLFFLFLLPVNKFFNK